MSENWSDEELAASLEAYSKMAQHEVLGRPYSKRDFYLQLVERFGRTPGSFEYRMQNISALVHKRVNNWVPGLKPAVNIGAGVEERIVRLLETSKGERLLDRVRKIASYKQKLPTMREWLIRVAISGKPVHYGDMMAVFDVDRFSLRHAMEFLGSQARELNEPILTALIVNKKTGRCSDGLEKEFGVLNDIEERQRLYKFWSEKPLQTPVSNSLSDEIEDKAIKFAIVAARPEQAAFRRAVYLAWKGKCVVSGCDIHRALDAAHKHGRHWSKGHNQAADGYLIRKDLHALYDCELLKISEEGVITLAPEIHAHYGQFQGRSVSQEPK
jgi:hypothetical protein